MKLLIVAVKDNAVQAFQAGIFTVRAEGEAIRNFQDAINASSGPQMQMFKHADDFDLYVLGTFDDSTGQITTEETPRQIARGKQLRLDQGISITRNN